MATWTPGHQYHLAAKSCAKSARHSQKAGCDDAAKKKMGFALTYELKALQTLLMGDPCDEVNLADFYKFAAIYARESGDSNQAASLLRTALEREVPNQKLRRELEGLLTDVEQVNTSGLTSK